MKPYTQRVGWEKLEPMENLKNFYREYLPIKPEGTFMTQHQS